MDGDVFPNTIEYWGPNGMVLFRNVQFRWMPLKGRNAVSIALERPGASNDQGRFVDRIELQGVRPHFNLPDLTANVRWTRDWGHFQVAGLLRRMAWVDTNNDELDLGGSAVGAGLNLTSALKFGENTTGKFALVFGQGIQNYMNDADVDVGIETNLAAGDPRRPIVGKALPMCQLYYLSGPLLEQALEHLRRILNDGYRQLQRSGSRRLPSRPLRVCQPALLPGRERVDRW